MARRSSAVSQLQMQLPLEFRAETPEPGSDTELLSRAQALLEAAGAARLAEKIRIRWSRRLTSSAGSADLRRQIITLNPRLWNFGEEEVNRTFLHELAHLLAYERAGRRRIPPHGEQWRQACADLGIPGESRCHELPLPRRRLEPRYIYRCEKCGREFQRRRRYRRSVACLECCRRYGGGGYDKRFRLQLIGGAMGTTHAARR